MSSDIPNKLSGNERSNSKRFTNCNSVSKLSGSAGGTERRGVITSV